MSVINNPLLLGQEGGAGYSIPRSLRFNSSDSAYLSRTPASAGNRRTWTWAGWVKRSALGVDQALFSAPQAGGYPNTGIAFNSSNQLRFFAADASSNSIVERVTSAVYRDTSAWMHIVVSVDYANSQAKVYVNGLEITAFATSTGPSNVDGIINSNGVVHVIGQFSNTWYLSAYLADIHFIDGQALTPSSFGEFDATTGVWNPKAYTGTYGTNGFHLPFSDNSTTAALGTDTSGNGNTWTVNNISVTAGAGNDSLVDSPTNGTASSGGDAGGVVVGNYATLNPLFAAGSVTYANGNLDASGNAQSGQSIGTIAVSSGKWYYEATLTTLSSTDPLFGISKVDALSGAYPGAASTSYAAYNNTGTTYIQKVNNGSFTNTNTTVAAQGDVIGVAFDLDNGKFWISKNGTWVDSGNPATGANALFSSLSGTFTPSVRVGGSSTGSCTLSCNFGQRPFAYAAPAGFKSLNTANLPTPTILKGSDYFDTKLYTGNGSTQTISGLAFSPDFVWIKERGAAGGHNSYDIVRGASVYLASESTNAEGTDTDALTAFTSSGFSLGSGYTVKSANGSGRSYAAWCWDAGSSNATNTQGSITSTVRANASAGFSAVTFTKAGGSSTAETIGHGLNATPYLIITKARNLTEPWYTYHNSLGNNGRVQLNETSAATIGTSVWGTTSPTSQVFTMQGVYNADYVAYCFAPVAGYSSMSSFVGNGSSDGVFVHTGFRPRFLLMKSATSATNWFMHDTARSSYNVAKELLFSNLSNAEDASNTYVDFLSNGFKLRFTNTDYNTSSQTYIYFAVAENPFSIARAR